MKIDMANVCSNPLKGDKFCSVFRCVSQEMLLIFFPWYVVEAVLHQCGT